MISRLWLLFALLVYVVNAGYREYAPEDVPNPLLHYSGCGRNEPSYVCDPSLYLSPSGLSQIDAILDNMKDRFIGPKACDSLSKPGYEVAVAIVPAMRFNHRYDKYYIAKEFANKLFNLWGIGDYYCNNGILLFLSIEDRVGYIATGTGARKRLTDSRARNVITHTMASNLRWGRYDSAVVLGLEKIEHHMNGPIPSWFSFWPVFFVFCMVGLSAWAIHSSSSQTRKYKQMKLAVKKLETDRDALLSNKYEAETCPICLKNLTFLEAVPVTDDEEVIQGPKKFIHSIQTYWSLFKRKVITLWKAAKAKVYEMTGNVRRPVTQMGFNEYHETVQNEDTHVSEYTNNAFGLPCGHIFCEKCIKPWLESKDTCPICKQSVLEDKKSSVVDNRQQEGVRNLAALERIETRREANLLARQLHNDLRWQALEFRARRLHWYYPRYVTRPMLNQFVTTPQSAYLSRHKHYVREQRRVEQQQRTTHSSRPRNRTNHRSSFGGGRASGGGGGGW